MAAKRSQRMSSPAYRRVSHQQLTLIFQLADAGRSHLQIAQGVGVHPSTVSRTLEKYADTRVLAKRIAFNAAAPLMERVLRDSDVNQALEVLDRTEALPRRIVDTGANTRVNIVIGMPGRPAGPDPFAELRQEVNGEIDEIPKENGRLPP